MVASQSTRAPQCQRSFSARHGRALYSYPRILKLFTRGPTFDRIENLSSQPEIHGQSQGRRGTKTVRRCNMVRAWAKFAHTSFTHKPCSSSKWAKIIFIPHTPPCKGRFDDAVRWSPTPRGLFDTVIYLFAFTLARELLLRMMSPAGV